MAKGAYIGIGNSSRKIKNIYFGIENVSRKVKKAYVGIGGVSKLWWKAENFRSLPPIEMRHAIGDVGIGASTDFAYVAGGRTVPYNYTVNTVDAFNRDLTRFSADNLTEGKYNAAGATVSNKVIFAGGGSPAEYSTRTTLTTDIYNNSLTKSVGPNLSYGGYEQVAPAMTSKYAFFIEDYVNMSQFNGQVYDASLTKTIIQAIPASSYRDHLKAASMSDHVIYSRGRDGNNYTLILYNYDNSLTMTQLNFFNENNFSNSPGAANINTTAIFSDYKTIAISNSLTLSKISDNLGSYCGSRVGSSYAVFPRLSEFRYLLIDDSFTINNIYDRTNIQWGADGWLVSTPFYDYALFTGSYVGSSFSKIVTVFSV